jgi:hypothetical protein
LVPGKRLMDKTVSIEFFDKNLNRVVSDCRILANARGALPFNRDSTYKPDYFASCAGEARDRQGPSWPERISTALN